MLPLVKTENSITLALVSPDSYKVQNEIARLLKNLTVIRRVISREDFHRTFDNIVQFQVNKSAKAEGAISDEDLQVKDDVFGEDIADTDQGDELMVGG